MSRKNSHIPTFGENFENIFEVISIDGHFTFHVAQDGTFRSTSQITHKGSLYVPAPIPRGLVESVTFPPSSQPFGTPAELAGTISKFIGEYGGIVPPDCDLLAAFAISTWFIDWLKTIPLINLTGTPDRVTLILGLLACVCRRPILLSYLDSRSLASLPTGLHPTFLIYQTEISKSVARLFHASRNREMGVSVGNRWIHCSGARAHFQDPGSQDDSSVRIHVGPTEATLPKLSDQAAQTITSDFQARLLRFRMTYFNAIKNATFETDAFDSSMRNDVAALVIPLTDCSEMKAAVVSRLLVQNAEQRDKAFIALDAVVIEAALFFCHASDEAHVSVKDLTTHVNAILVGRHALGNKNEKLVGAALRALGLRAGRVTAGYRIELTGGIREIIHLLAAEHAVPSVRNGVARCQHCRPRGDQQNMHV